MMFRPSDAQLEALGKAAAMLLEYSNHYWNESFRYAKKQTAHKSRDYEVRSNRLHTAHVELLQIKRLLEELEEL